MVVRTIALSGFESVLIPGSFELLYIAHRDSVLRYLRAKSDDAEALDLAAITFERAYRTLVGGKPVDLAWMLRTARNAAIDSARRQRVRHLVELVLFRATAEGQPSPEVALIAAEQTTAVRAAVSRLPAIQREAIALRYGARLSAREIGSVIGKTEAATQKLLSRALATLRENLNGQL
jgi:RNA polymerase sigma-70 factor (ECF subfamily)